MKVFENDAQLNVALDTLSKAGLIEITMDDDGKPRVELSAAIIVAAEQADRR